MAAMSSFLQKGCITILSLLTVVVGVIVVIIASITIREQYSVSKSNMSEFSPSYVILAFGILTTVAGLCGFYGAIAESRKLLYGYAILGTVLFFVDLVIGVVLLASEGRLKKAVRVSLKESFDKYNTKDKSRYEIKTIRTFLDKFQKQVECCGFNSFKDWVQKYNQPKPPQSCCKKGFKCDTSKPVNVFQEGCLQKMNNSISKVVFFLGLFSIILAFFQCLLCCTACALARKTSDPVNRNVIR